MTSFAHRLQKPLLRSCSQRYFPSALFVTTLALRPILPTIRPI